MHKAAALDPAAAARWRSAGPAERLPTAVLGRDAAVERAEGEAVAEHAGQVVDGASHGGFEVGAGCGRPSRGDIDVRPPVGRIENTAHLLGDLHPGRPLRPLRSGGSLGTHGSLRSLRASGQRSEIAVDVDHEVEAGARLDRQAAAVSQGDDRRVQGGLSVQKNDRGDERGRDAGRVDGDIAVRRLIYGGHVERNRLRFRRKGAVVLADHGESTDLAGSHDGHSIARGHGRQPGVDHPARCDSDERQRRSRLSRGGRLDRQLLGLAVRRAGRRRPRRCRDRPVLHRLTPRRQSQQQSRGCGDRQALRDPHALAPLSKGQEFVFRRRHERRRVV